MKKTTLAVTLLAAMAAGAWAAAQTTPAAPTDLDTFMGQVLARRDENWKKLQQYILEEREVVDVKGPTGKPVWGEERDYSWFIREGYFIRSPLKVNGITIAETERRKAEDQYLRRMKSRDRGAGRRGQAAAPAEPGSDADQGQRRDVEGLILQNRQPDFIDSAYFLRFKFEQGKYALVGRERYDTRDVLRIEYYPARLFSHEQDQQQRRQKDNRTDREKDIDAAVERMMNKVSLVTLWVEPDAHQIVKYTFDNVNFDFLPAAWLVRITEARAIMTMNQPFPDVWLPAAVDMNVSATLAVGAFAMRYHLEYRDYKQAETSARIIRGGGPGGGLHRP